PWPERRLQRTIFIRGRAVEMDSLSGLDSVAYRFMEAFLHYLRFSGIQGVFRKYTHDKELIEGELVGKSIKPDVWFLKRAAEDQNGKLTQKELFRVFKSHSRNKKLLLVACSATKDETDQELPALLRYAGMTYFLIKALLINRRWPKVDLLIVSAKHGLLHPLDTIAYYDYRLTENRLEKARQEIREQVVAHGFKHYSECFLNLPDLYLQAIEPIKTRLSENCLIACTGTGRPHERNTKMIQWLENQFVRY
ncbi:MAG: DUF6884 domain-containing protein, partial [Candidatus Odinarchaeota archaeon]